jgi:hypothetical protein
MRWAAEAHFEKDDVVGVDDENETFNTNVVLLGTTLILNPASVDRAA